MSETFADREDWQLGEINEGIKDLDSGKTVSHEEEAKWLRSWGTAQENQAPQFRH